MNIKPHLYCAVTNDKFEFVIEVCDSLKDLSIKVGRSPNALKCAICRGEVDRKNNCKYIRVDFDDEEPLED